MILQPTVKFRYKLLSNDDVSLNNPKTIVFRRLINSDPSSHGWYILEQWWENITDGGGEWRQIEIEK